jgi:ADP-heptose:LPS heptosyltransferase
MTQQILNLIQYIINKRFKSKKQDRLLIVFLHGFGDSVMLTPSLKHLSKKYQIDVVTYDATLSHQLLENLCYVNKVIKVSLGRHPKYWNPIIFWACDYWVILKKVFQCCDLSIYTDIKVVKIYCLPHFMYSFFPFLLKRNHKIDQIAYDLGIKTLQDKKTEVSIPSKNVVSAVKFANLNLINSKLTVLIHSVTVEKERDIPPEFVNDLISHVLDIKDSNVVICGSKESYYQIYNREYEYIKSDRVFYTFNSVTSLDIMTVAELIRNSTIFIGIDSSLLHIAGALQVDTIAIFNRSKIKPNQRVAFNKNIYSVEAQYNSDQLVEIFNSIVKIPD